MNTPTQAHARRDLLDRGVEYLAGDPFPVEGQEAEHLRRLHQAALIEWGPPPASLAEWAKNRRAAAAAEPAPAVDGDEMTEDELEAATTPAAPAETRRAAVGKRRG